MNNRICKKCNTSFPKTEEFFPRNGKFLKTSCRTCTNAYAKQYREGHKEKIKDAARKLRDSEIFKSEKAAEARQNYQKEWHQKNKKRKNEKRNLRRKNSASDRATENIRKRISRVLIGTSKSKSSLELLGYCSSKWKSRADFYSFVRKYFEDKFLDGMSWSNYGNPNGDHSDCWHIDHIVPCSVFSLEKDSHQKACFHYTNLQPLWGTDNLSKSDILPTENISKLIQKLNIL